MRLHTTEHGSVIKFEDGFAQESVFGKENPGQTELTIDQAWRVAAILDKLGDRDTSPLPENDRRDLHYLVADPLGALLINESYSRASQAINEGLSPLVEKYGGVGGYAERLHLTNPDEIPPLDYDGFMLCRGITSGEIPGLRKSVHALADDQLSPHTASMTRDIFYRAAQNRTRKIV
jgi:hypothetical protein